MLDRSYSKEIEYIIKTLEINKNMLASKSGLSRDTIVKILEGRKDIKYDTLNKIINAFYIDENWFYKGLNKPFIKEYGSYKDAGKRIKQIRKDNHLTLIEFSKKCHIDYAALSRIENGKAKLSLITGNKIANSFKVDIDYLLYGFK